MYLHVSFLVLPVSLCEMYEKGFTLAVAVLYF